MDSRIGLDYIVENPEYITKLAGGEFTFFSELSPQNFWGQRKTGAFIILPKYAGQTNWVYSRIGKHFLFLTLVGLHLDKNLRGFAEGTKWRVGHTEHEKRLFKVYIIRKMK